MLKKICLKILPAPQMRVNNMYCTDHTISISPNEKYKYYTFSDSTCLKPDDISIKYQVDSITGLFYNNEEYCKAFNISKEEIYFKKIIERNPNRVYEFIFQDNTHIKTICAEEDLNSFSLEYAFFLALAKYLYSEEYTFEGVINKSYELMTQKKYIKIVNKGIKVFKIEQKQKEEIEKKEKRNKEIQKNHYLKNQKRKKAQKEKENNILKETIKEAINESK